jgi:exosortase
MTTSNMTSGAATELKATELEATELEATELEATELEATGLVPRPGGRTLLIVLAVLVAPPLWDLQRASQQGDSGGQVPLVCAGIAFLVWRDRAVLALRVVQPLWPGILALAPLIPAYVLARITGTPTWELAATLAIVLVIAWLELGGAVLRRFWFAAVLALFLGTPSSGMLDAFARALKQWLPPLAAILAQAGGLRVGATGAIIQVDGYQLQVANACSGINSLIGIAAISLFYVHVRRGAEPAYAMVLALLLVPVAIAANLARILLLIGATHWYGEAPVEGLFHPVAGLGVFALAVAMLFVLDAALYPVMRRR